MRDTDNPGILAVRDAYEKRLRRAVELTGAKPHWDYRRLPEDRNIDYVGIATPQQRRYRMPWTQPKLANTSTSKSPRPRPSSERASWRRGSKKRA